MLELLALPAADAAALPIPPASLGVDRLLALVAYTHELQRVDGMRAGNLHHELNQARRTRTATVCTCMRLPPAPTCGNSIHAHAATACNTRAAALYLPNTWQSAPLAHTGAAAPRRGGAAAGGGEVGPHVELKATLHWCHSSELY